MVTRRDVMKGVGATAFVVASPAPRIAAAPANEPTLAFVVGSPGEHDGLFIRAKDAREAFRMWGEEQGHYAGSPECALCYDHDDPKGDCTCDPTYYAARMKRWDKLEGDPSSGMWLDAGLGHICDRCHYETMGGDGYNIGGDAVCADCMTLEDWKTQDPEYYADLVDDLLTDEYGEATV